MRAWALAFGLFIVLCVRAEASTLAVELTWTSGTVLGPCNMFGTCGGGYSPVYEFDTDVDFGTFQAGGPFVDGRQPPCLIFCLGNIGGYRIIPINSTADIINSLNLMSVFVPGGIVGWYVADGPAPFYNVHVTAGPGKYQIVFGGLGYYTPPSPVPLPATLPLFIAGLGALAYLRRRLSIS